MAVAQFVEHIGAQIEKFQSAHFLFDPRTVALIDIIPVDTFFFKETIVLINNSPQCIKIARTVVIPLLHFMTCGESNNSHKTAEYISKNSNHQYIADIIFAFGETRPDLGNDSHSPLTPMTKACVTLRLTILLALDERMSQR